MILVEGLGANQIVLIGSAVPLSVGPKVRVDSFCIYSQDKPGLIALSVRSQETRTNHGFLLEIDQHEIKLGSRWVPPRERPGQIQGTSLQVEIEGKVFSTDWSAALTHDMSYVPDANLLLRYLIGDADAQEVKTAAKRLGAAEQFNRLLDNVREAAEELRKTAKEKTVPQRKAAANLLKELSGKIAELSEKIS